MRINQAPTACDSFHAHTDCGMASSQRELIVGYMELRGGTWSIGELASALDMQKSTVSARLNELIEAGTVEVRPKRKDRISNISIRPVGLPRIQMDLFQ